MTRDFRTPTRATWTHSAEWSRGSDDAKAGKEWTPGQSADYTDGYWTAHTVMSMMAAYENKAVSA